jgi:uncharacterized protein
MNNYIVILIGIILFSCEQKRVEYYPDGSLKTEFLLKDGKREGEFMEYFLNGKLKQKCNYKNGKIDGIKEDYDSLGNLREKVRYIDGIENGEFTHYKNGKIDIKGNFKNGKHFGIYTSYFSNGKPELIVNYYNENNEGDNVKQSFDSLGRLTFEIAHKDGIPHGKVRSYKNGKIDADGMHCYDKPCGKWLLYEDGVLSKMIIHDDFGKILEAIIYDDKGNVVQHIIEGNNG